MRFTKTTIAASMLVMATMASVCEAGMIYMETDDSQLRLLDPTTGAYTNIAKLSVLLVGLGFGSDGQLYGTGPDDTNGTLYRVNTTTGALTSVGLTGVNLYYDSFGATSDGTLYLQSSGQLYAVSPRTGVATAVGSLGLSTPDGINGDDGGHLYVTYGNGLYQVDRSTGASSLIGSGVMGTAYGLAFANKTLYEINTAGQIYAMDRSDGSSTLIATTVSGVYAAAARLQSVPEPSSLILLGTGTVGLLGLMKRRRSRVGEAA